MDKQTAFLTFTCNGKHTPNAALPVNMLSFTGKNNITENIINWTTTFEQNSDYFEVEHSNNGIEYTSVGKVNTKRENDNSASNINYECIDSKPYTGHNYYRLKQVDLDGRMNIESQVIDVFRENDKSTIHAYPIPTNRILHVECALEYEGATNLILTDLSGKLVKELQTLCTKGFNVMDIDLKDFKKGVYVLQIMQRHALISTQKIEKN